MIGKDEVMKREKGDRRVERRGIVMMKENVMNSMKENISKNGND